MTSLEEMAASALTRGASYPALEWEKHWIDWGEMRRVADHVNQLLDTSGVHPSAPIAFAPRNRPVAVAALLGLIARGRHISMIHVYQSAAGIARDIAGLRPAAVIGGDEDLTDEVAAVLREKRIAGIVLSEMDVSAIPGCEKSMAAWDPLPPQPQIGLLTSGTTGTPKQFPLSYDMIAQDIVGMNLIGSPDSDPAAAPPMLLFYPLGTFSGLYSNLTPLLQGFRGVLIDRFNLAGWHDFILRYRPDWANVPPSGIQMILESNIPSADLASIRFIRTGTAPLDPTAHREFEERYGKPIILAYGATEFGGPVTSMSLELYKEWGQEKFGTVGRAFAGAKLRVIDPETGAVMSSGEGLLEVISPRMGPDWIRTSDIVMLDEDGFLFHRGRADGAIMRGGFKLLPDTIERALGLHDAVSAAGVTAIPDKRLGQAPAVAIQLKPGVAKPTIAELEQHLRDQVEATHIPVVWQFVETLPYTPMMKVDRVALRRLFDAGDESVPGSKVSG